MTKRGVFQTIHGAWSRVFPSRKPSPPKWQRADARRSLLLEPLEDRALLSVTHFGLIMPPMEAPGKAVPIQVIALDAQNQPVSTYSGTVKVTSSDGKASLPTSVTLQDGRAMFQANFATAGSESVIVQDESNVALAGKVATNVTAATQFAFYIHSTAQLPFLPPGRPNSVSSETPVTVQVFAFGAQGQPASSYSGTATVTCSDSTVTLPTSITFTNGVASFQVTFATTGQDTLTVTDSGNSSLTSTATINVTAPATATHFGILVHRPAKRRQAADRTPPARPARLLNCRLSPADRTPLPRARPSQ